MGSRSLRSLWTIGSRTPRGNGSSRFHKGSMRGFVGRLPNCRLHNIHPSVDGYSYTIYIKDLTWKHPFQTGTVCGESYFNDIAATVICREMGQNGGVSWSRSGNWNSRYAVLRNVRCTDKKNPFSSCTYYSTSSSSYYANCYGNYRYVHLVCSGWLY